MHQPVSDGVYLQAGYQDSASGSAINQGCTSGIITSLRRRNHSVHGGL